MPATDSDIDVSDAPHEAGQYANYFEIGHNAFEFVLDLGQLYEGEGRPRFHTRVITGPMHAKALSHTLNDAVGEYERDFGAIDEAPEPEASAENVADGEPAMIAPAPPPSKSTTPDAGGTSATSLQDLAEQLSESIQQLQESISAEEASLAAQAKQLTDAKEALTASQQALQQEEQLATAYGEALGRFDAGWNALKQPLETVLGKVKCALDEEALAAIAAKVKAYDDAGSALVKALETAQAAQAAADTAAAEAKAVHQQESAALEQLAQAITDKGTAVDAWRASIVTLGQDLQAIDAYEKPARGWFLLAEVDGLVDKRKASPTAEKYRDDLDAQSAKVIGAKRDVAEAVSKADEAAEAAQQAAAAWKEHDGKRREVLLAAMDELDAARPPQAQPAPAHAAAR